MNTFTKVSCNKPVVHKKWTSQKLSVIRRVYATCKNCPFCHRDLKSPSAAPVRHCVKCHLAWPFQELPRARHAGNPAIWCRTWNTAGKPERLFWLRAWQARQQEAGVSPTAPSEGSTNWPQFEFREAPTFSDNLKKYKVKVTVIRIFVFQ